MQVRIAECDTVYDDTADSDPAKPVEVFDFIDNIGPSFEPIT